MVGLLLDQPRRLLGEQGPVRLPDQLPAGVSFVRDILKEIGEDLDNRLNMVVADAGMRLT